MIDADADPDPDAEIRRQAIQDRLDADRSAAERNRLGQFATPRPLALEMARYALGRWRERAGDSIAFFDPAIGSGAFYSAVRDTVPTHLIADACGVEIDPRFAGAARSLWAGSGLRVIPGDFTATQPDRAYNLVLTNPPYVRHHHLDRGEKERLRAMVAARLGLDVSGLAGLYTHFLLLCDAWLAPGGLAVWLVPSEFMDVNYGAAVRRYLTERVRLLHIHRFVPADVQFEGALVTSAIVVFEKSSPPAGHRVRLSLGGPITDPGASAMVALAALRQASKWTSMIEEPDRGVEPASSRRLGEFFAVKRGLATGANAFFILDRQEARRQGIPPGCLRPILPGARHLTSPVIESQPDGYPRLDPALAVIDCNLPEPVIRRRYPGFSKYLELGKARGVDAGYLASRRTPWYSQEQREPAPFVCTYMGRATRDGPPFRFFWNRSRATAANVYLMLYPRGELASALDARPELYPIVLDALRALAAEHAVRGGRVYGGGLHKLEPRELAGLPADALARVIAGATRETILE